VLKNRLPDRSRWLDGCLVIEFFSQLFGLPRSMAARMLNNFGKMPETVWLVLTAGGSSVETWQTGQIFRQFTHNENSDPKGSFLSGAI
jgi:hypothetical protein